MKVLWFRQVWQLMRRENLTRLAFLILIMVLLSASGLSFFEPETDFWDALWLSVVTMTTVGYGDISPTTSGGRMIGVLMMFFGIGVLGMFSATVAGVLVEKKMKKDRGMSSFELEDHIIICGWNHKAHEILREIRADSRATQTPVAIIAQLESCPEDDDNLHFVRGEISDETLRRAAVQSADTVIILGDLDLEGSSRDAQAVLATLTVETLNPDAYTIVELESGSNSMHCERANADEIIVSSEFSCRLISRAACDHGITTVLSRLLSSSYAADLFRIPVPDELTGKDFFDVFCELKRTRNGTVLALQHGENGTVIPNPDGDIRVEKGDSLIVVASGRLS